MEREALPENLAADHITNRNNGRKSIGVRPCKTSTVPSICRKRIQETMSFGKKLQHMTGTLQARPTPINQSTKHYVRLIETNTTDDGIEIGNSRFTETEKIDESLC